MKWLLISEYGNPGDEWARLGVIQIIRAVDEQAEISVINKDKEEIHTPRPFDVSVFCGQPLIWSHRNHNTTFANWWVDLNGWLSSNRRLIMAGWGIYASWSGELFTSHKLYNEEAIQKAIRPLVDRCALSYCRSEVGRSILGPDTLVMPCPSIFAGMNIEKSSDLKLCNLMPNGGHERVMNGDEANRWNDICQSVSDVLRDCGFTFISHNKKEEDLAVSLGWEPSRILKWDGDPMKHLQYYARAERYWGNRIHGAIVTAGFGKDAHCCCYDTRAAAVKLVGGSCVRPSKVEPEAIRQWAISPATPASCLSVVEEFDKQVAAFKGAITNLGK